MDNLVDSLNFKLEREVKIKYIYMVLILGPIKPALHGPIMLARLRSVRPVG